MITNKCKKCSITEEDDLAEVSIPKSKRQFENVSREGRMRCEATD